MRTKIQGKVRYVARNLLAVLLEVTVVSVSCSQPTSIQRIANVISSPLPPPDPNKYSDVRDARDWQNPYLRVQTNGIDARPNSTPTKVAAMSPGEVVTYLEKLPSTAWPYGLVVAVQENGLRNPGDDAPIKRNREGLVRLLEKAGIKVDWWPS
jgi:hypothetical protein